MTPPSCSQCRDLSDSGGEKKPLVLIDNQKKRTHDVGGEGCVLMVVRAVSVPPGVFMQDEDNIGANLNEGFLFKGKPQLSLGPVLCKSSGWLPY